MQGKGGSNGELAVGTATLPLWKNESTEVRD
jgi:hypothetical protein